MIVLWTIRISLACLAVAWWCQLQQHRAAALRWHAVGWTVYVLHVLAAFHFTHDWSHAAAVRHTAEVSRRVTGIEAGYGIYFNHLFTIVWLAQVYRLWKTNRVPTSPPVLAVAASRGAGRWRVWLVRGLTAYMVFMVVQGAVVFAPPIFAITAAVVLGWLAVTGRVRQRKTGYESQMTRETPSESTVVGRAAGGAAGAGGSQSCDSASIGRVAYLTAGAGGMFCGSCMHDNALVKALGKHGVDAVLIPTYTPIRTDEQDVSQQRVFFGGINVYLRQKMPWLGRLPRFLTSWMDNPRLLRWVASRAMKTSAADLGDLTISMLQGADGPQRGEVRQLVDWLEREVRPAVVVLSNMLIAGCVPEIKRRLKVPVLITLQGDDIFLRDLPPTHLQRCRTLLAQLDAHVDGYVTNSNYYAQWMCQELSLPAEKFRVVPLCIDTDDFAVENDSVAESADRPLTIGYLARLAPEKGLHLLANAFIRLATSGAIASERPLRLRIAGWLGPQNESYTEEVFGTLRKAGLEDRFEYVGEIDRQQKADFLRSIDVLSVPTVYQEPKGLFVLEALASGVPVVQPDHGAFPELLEQTSGGLLFRAHDDIDLAEKLGELLNDEQRRRELGAAGRAAVMARHNSKAMFEHAVTVYRDAIGRPP